MDGGGRIRQLANALEAELGSSMARHSTGTWLHPRSSRKVKKLSSCALCAAHGAVAQGR